MGPGDTNVAHVVEKIAMVHRALLNCWVAGMLGFQLTVVGSLTGNFGRGLTDVCGLNVVCSSLNNKSVSFDFLRHVYSYVLVFRLDL